MRESCSSGQDLSVQFGLRAMKASPFGVVPGYSERESKGKFELDERRYTSRGPDGVDVG
jgi:hypothetical protein